MSIRKRGDKWLVTVELGRDESGRRLRDCSTHDTEKAAIAAESIAKGEIAKGEWFDETDLLCGPFLDGWLEHKKPHVAPSTHAMWSDFIRCHMKPAFGRLPLAKLSGLHIEHYEARLLSRGRRPLDRHKLKKGETPIVPASAGLSATTVHKHRVMLRQALTYAVRHRLIRTNPTDGLDPIPEDDHEIRWLELTEQDRLLTVARAPRSARNPDPHRVYVPTVTALGTGMRKGEILALRRSDVMFGTSKIAVRRGLQWQPGGAYGYRKGGKNGKGRVISAPAMLLELLAEQLRRQEAMKATAGEAWVSEDLVFSGPDGRPLNRDGFKSSWARLVTKADLVGVRFHDLRHTHATELLRAGVHPKIVSERLGHSSVKITLDRYSHAIPDLQTEAAEKTDALLRGLLASPGGDAAP